MVLLLVSLLLLCAGDGVDVMMTKEQTTHEHTKPNQTKPNHKTNFLIGQTADTGERANAVQGGGGGTNINIS